MTEPGEQPGVGVADLEWVWEALDPEVRQDRLRALARWVDWVTTTYELADQIPPCWYRHPGAVARLTAAWVAWLRTYVEDGPGRATALVEFHDALDRMVATLGLPKKCRQGLHHATGPDPGGSSGGGFEQWLATSTWARAPAEHPAPEFTNPRGEEPAMTDAESDLTRISTAEMGQHVAAGEATQLGQGDAYYFRGAWWVGDGGSYVRIDDEAFAADLDRMAAKLAAAEGETTRSGDTDSARPGEHGSGS